MNRIIEFEGRRIEVPADFTDEEVAQVLASPPAAPPSAAAAPPAAAAPARPAIAATGPGPGGYALETVGQAARGARRGIANLAGLPVDAITAGLNFLPGVNIQRPVGGSDWIDSALGGFGALPEAPTPRDGVQRMARRGGEEIGAAALTVVVPAAAVAQRGLQSAAQVRAAMPGVFGRYFAEPYAVNPVRYIATQLGIGTGAGIGAGTANEITRGAGYDRSTTVGQVGDIAGSLAGGTVAGLAGATAQAGANAVRRVRAGANNYSDDVSNASAAQLLGSFYGYDAVEQLPRSANPVVRGVQEAINHTPVRPGNFDPLVAAIDSGRRPGEVIPGFQETLPDRLPSATVNAAAFSRAAGPRADAFNARAGANAEAVDASLQAIAPQGQPGAFVEAVRRVRDARIAGAEADAQQAAVQADQILQRLSPSMTAEQRGAMIREALQNAEDRARAGVTAAYGQADTSAATFDPAALRQALDGVGAGLTEVERGLAPQSLLARLAPAGEGAPAGPMRFAELESLRSELLRLQRAALADPTAERGGANAARVLQQYVQAVEGVMDGALPPETLAALRTARDTARSRAESFGRPGDPVAQALALREGGRPAVPDSRVPGIFVRPDADMPMQRLLAEADTPEVRAAIRDELLARAGTATARADAVRDFTEQYGAALNRFPGLADELRSAANARDAAVAARGAAETTARDLTSPSRTAIAGVADFGPERARDAVARVVSDSNPGAAADEVLGAIGNDPAALQGARRAFWDLMESRTRSRGETTATSRNVQPWLGQKLQAALNEPGMRAVLQRLYANEPDHIQRLDQIANVLTTVNQSMRGRAANASGTGQTIAGTSRNILTPETVMSRTYAMQAGRVSEAYTAVSIIGIAYRVAMRTGRLAGVQNAVDEALLNPEFARMLLERYNPANLAAMRRMVTGAGLNRASEFTRLLDSAEEDPVTRAVQEPRR